LHFSFYDFANVEFNFRMKHNFLSFFAITISKYKLEKYSKVLNFGILNPQPENFLKVWNFGKVNRLLLKKAIVCL